MVVITGDVEVARGESVDAVVVIDGDVRIAGHVDGSVVVVNGTTTISGSVDGDLVTIAGPARLLPGALVDGDIQYGDEKPVIAPGATVTGDIDHEGWTRCGGVFAVVGALALWLAVTVSTLILGLLLLVAAPQAADAALRQARRQIWVAVAVGFARLHRAAGGGGDRRCDPRRPAARDRAADGAGPALGGRLRGRRLAAWAQAGGGRRATASSPSSPAGGSCAASR